MPRIIALAFLLASHAAFARCGDFIAMPCGAPLYTMMSTALPFIFTSAPRNGSELSGDLSDESSASDTKLLLAAQDDAAAFIASDGQVRGAFLEAALRRLRSRSGAQIYDDRQLALALLSRAD